MTTAMIEITTFHEKTLTRVNFAPFAWFSWPMELVNLVLREIKTLAGGPRVTGGPVKEVFIKDGCLKDHRGQIVVRTSTLSPIFYVTRYESAEDFKKVSTP